MKTLESKKILGVASLTRHGARAPASADKDYRDFFGREWKMGIGNLTDKGKLQLFEKGRAHSMKYKEFLKNLSKEEMLFFSTNVERTIQSMFYKIKGMLHSPPNDSDNCLETIHTQSLDKKTPNDENIHEFSVNFDEAKYPDIHVLKEEFIFPHLPKFYKGDNLEEFNKVTYQHLLEEFHTKLEYANTQIYPKIKHLINPDVRIEDPISALIETFDALLCIKTNGEDLTQLGLDEGDVKFACELVTFYFTHIFIGSKEKIKVAVIPLLKYLIDYFIRLKEGKEKVKYIGISFHDNNLAFLLSFLNNIYPIYGKYNPSIQFASEMLFELFEVKEENKSSFIIEMSFDNEKYFEDDLDEFSKKVNNYIDDKQIYVNTLYS
jgi:hypothetical protein